MFKVSHKESHFKISNFQISFDIYFDFFFKTQNWDCQTGQGQLFDKK